MDILLVFKLIVLIQINNGIPILDFIDNKSDIELLELSIYLKSIVYEPDLKICNKNHFKL